MDKNTGISLGAVVVAAIAVGVSTTGRDTKTLVSASEAVADIEVAEIVKDSEFVTDVTCQKQWAFVRGEKSLVWICSDVGYSPERQAVLNKRAGVDGVRVSYNPEEQADGSLLVGVTVATGDNPAEPTGELLPYVPPVTEEEEEIEVVEK